MLDLSASEDMLLVLQTVFGFREKGSGRAKLSSEFRLFEL